MAGKSCVPRKLARADVREGFTSGARELDEWLIRYSWQNQRADNAVTYVSVLDERVVGYWFYLAHAEILDSPSDPLHLLLPVKDIDRAFRPSR